MATGRLIVLLKHIKQRSFIKRIRKVPLLPDEAINCIVSATAGLIREPESTGQLLVTTNQRILLFAYGPKGRDTILLPIKQLTGHTLKDKDNSHLSLFQGLLVLAAGVLIYLFSGYWLSDHLEGPNIPLINMDLWAVILLASLITGGWLVWRYYFAKKGFQITFKVSYGSYDFEYLGPESDLEQIIETALICGYGGNNLSHDHIYSDKDGSISKSKPNS